MSVESDLPPRPTKEDTRQRLLHAAGRVFGAHGFGGASMKAIAAAAGYTTGALYDHFAGKEDLFLALMDARMDVQAATVAAVVDGVADPLTQMQRWFEQTVTADPSWSLLAAEFSIYARRHPEVAQKLMESRRRARDGLAEVIEHAYQRAGTKPPRGPAELAELALALGNGLTEARHLDPDVPLDLFAYGVGRMLSPEQPHRGRK